MVYKHPDYDPEDRLPVSPLDAKIIIIYNTKYIDFCLRSPDARMTWQTPTGIPRIRRIRPCWGGGAT